MKTATLRLLPVLIATALATSTAYAQDQDECAELDGAPAGLYVTTDEGLVFVEKDDKLVELAPGESAFANESGLTCIKKMPEFLNWPCSTDAAQSRMFATYRIDTITSTNVIAEVVRRYFEIPEVIEPIPNWIDGEITTTLPYQDLVPYASTDYWYRINDPADMVHEKRPTALLISLFVGTNQVVLDNNALDVLRELHRGKPIPVVFVFNDSNVVPVSYFGSNVSLEELMRAFTQRSIKLADVPMWQLGDYHFTPTAKEYQKLVDLPSIDSIDPFRLEALRAQIETYGFSRKPVFATLLEGSTKLYVDDPQMLAVAISMGVELIPTVVNFVEQDAHLRRCGPGTPAGSSGVSGASTPIGGATVPPGAVSPPPPVEPPASDS